MRLAEIFVVAGAVALAGCGRPASASGEPSPRAPASAELPPADPTYLPPTDAPAGPWNQVVHAGYLEYRVTKAVPLDRATLVRISPEGSDAMVLAVEYIVTNRSAVQSDLQAAPTPSLFTANGLTLEPDPDVTIRLRVAYGAYDLAPAYLSPNVPVKMIAGFEISRRDLAANTWMITFAGTPGTSLPPLTRPPTSPPVASAAAPADPAPYSDAESTGMIPKGGGSLR